MFLHDYLLVCEIYTVRTLALRSQRKCTLCNRNELGDPILLHFLVKVDQNVYQNITLPDTIC